MARVLVIDDDAPTLLYYKRILRDAGHDVVTVALGDDGLSASYRGGFDVVLCDYLLPDVSGIEVIRQINERSPQTAIVLITGWGRPELIVDAKRVGATNFVMKPLIGDDLVSLVSEAMRLKADSPISRAKPANYATRRWADLIARGANAADDPRTVFAWCRCIGIARGTLQKRCEAVGITPKEALDFLRLLRLSVRHAGEPWDLQYRLDITDLRTVRALMQRAGFGPDVSHIPSLESFLLHQQLILAADVIDAVRLRLGHVLAV